MITRRYQAIYLSTSLACLLLLPLIQHQSALIYYEVRRSQRRLASQKAFQQPSLPNMGSFSLEIRGADGLRLLAIFPFSHQIKALTTMHNTPVLINLIV